MAFTEENAIESIKNLLNFNDYSKIVKILNTINPEIFEDESIKKKFKEILVTVYNADNLNYIKNLFPMDLN